MYSTKISSDITVDKKTGKASGDLKVSVNGYTKSFSGELKEKNKPSKKEQEYQNYYPKGACADAYRTMLSHMLGWKKKLRNL